MMTVRIRILQLPLLFLAGIGLACDGRAVSSFSDGALGRGDGGQVWESEPSSGPLPHCSGGDKLILDGKLLPNNTRAGMVFAGSLGDHLRVTISDSINSSWSGVFVDVVAPMKLAPGAPLKLDLSALGPGWKLSASRFGGVCLKDNCKSNASPLVQPTDHFRVLGLLQLEAGSTQAVTLCFSASKGVAQPPFLERYVKRAGLERK